MTAATWISIYRQPADAAATGEALKFFAWAYKNGDKMADELDYVPMPENIVKDVEKYWADGNQGRERQAPFRADQLIQPFMGRAPTSALSSFRGRQRDGLCRGLQTA